MAKAKKEVNEDEKIETGNNDLVKFLLSNSNSKYISTVQDSKYFDENDVLIDTKIPMLNIALSGRISGGFPDGGITSIVGEPKMFKTMYALYMVKAYLDYYPKSVCLLVDTEGGSSRKYFRNVGIDESRIVWLPCENIEEMKTEVSMKLDALKKANNSDFRICMMVDSVGNVPSIKEVNDAVSGEMKTDMTRAKQIKSFFRIITMPIKLLKIPTFVINHTYKSQSFIPEDIISGGNGSLYSSDSILLIRKRQIKDSDKELEGFTFEININRSRYAKEKSKLPIEVFYGEGLSPYSGLYELAKEMKIVEEIKNGKIKYLKFGELEIPVEDNGFDVEFWNAVLEQSNFEELVRTKYAVEKVNKN